MIVSELRGDLVATLKKAIDTDVSRPFFMAQGCNCFVTQGSGIAGQLRSVPAVYQADVDYGREGDITKLGEMSVAVWEERAAVFNLYTQYHYGAGVRQVDYCAVKESVREMCRYLEGVNAPVFVPLIGAGLAGGEWDLIRACIDKASGKTRIIVVHFEQDKILDW
ncbi:hypothetical protein MYOV011v1_p0081 [Vibrio phage 6E35.1a]|nr:hypothetical protein MYOV011v1_p0081 [Vibrio phage 6E35.1a]